MLSHYPVASVLDDAHRRVLVLKAVAWGPPGETLATVAAKLLHGELVAFVASEWPDGLFQGHNSHTGVSLLEFDPLGAVVNVAFLATAGPGILAPLLAELAALAQRYGFHTLECYSRRPGMGRLLARLGWQQDEGVFEPLPGFRRFYLPLPQEAPAGRRSPSWLAPMARAGVV